VGSSLRRVSLRADERAGGRAPNLHHNYEPSATSRFASPQCAVRKRQVSVDAYSRSSEPTTRREEAAACEKGSARCGGRMWPAPPIAPRLPERMTLTRLRNIPKPLLADLALGQVVPVVGAGFSLNADVANGTMPTWAGLAKELSSDLPNEHLASSDPLEVISAYEQEHSRVHLVRRLFTLLHVNSSTPGRAHRSLVSLPVERIVTTNFDLLLDDALRELRIEFFPVVDESQLTIAGSRRERVLVKAHGDIHHPDRLVLTEDDYDMWLRRNPLLATELASLFVRGSGLLLGYSLSDPDLRQILGVLRDRLGRLSRQLYVLLPNPSAATRARFERRGVKVVDLRVRKDETIDDAYADVFDEIAALMRSAGVSELRESQPDLSDYLVPELRESPVVLFAVPKARLRLYRDYLFPEVIRLGLVPYTTDEVPSGVPLLSAIEGIIERAVVVVSEPSTSPTGTELSSATRAGTRLLVVSEKGGRDGRIDEMVNRDTILSPASEDDWRSFASWFAHWLADASRNVRHQLVLEPERLLAAGQPRAAILTGFAYLESALRRQLRDLIVPDRLIGIRQLLEVCAENEIIDHGEFTLLMDASRLRNELAHTDRSVSSQAATQAVRAISHVLRRLPQV
jgi:hypothetical protein